MRNGLFSIVTLLVCPLVVGCAGSDSGSNPATATAGGSGTTMGSDGSGSALSTSGSTGQTVSSTTTTATSTSAGGVTGGSDDTSSTSQGGANDTAGPVTTGSVSGTGGALGVGGATGTGGLGGASMSSSSGGAGGGEPCVVDHGGQAPSLGDYYAGQFAIGAAIDAQYNNYSGLLTKHFNSVTAENEMKFDSLEPTENNFTYGTADQMVDFATQNGMQVRGHALVWHRQTPSWVFSGSSEQVLARMKNHITKVMQHFQGKVKTWDVVNEAIMDTGLYRTNNEAEGQQSGWYGALGESYIAEAFKAARQADPAAKLFYNDYYNYHPVRRQAIYDMLAGLRDAGVPIDGVGLQCHLNLEPGTDSSEQSYYQTVENLEQAVEMYSSLGLEVQITEMDVSLYLRGIQYTPDMFYTPATFTAELKEQQAERYREFFDMFRAHSDVISSVTFWGIADDNTWLSEFDSGRQDFPLLFDAQQQPKPAFWAVVDFCN